MRRRCGPSRCTATKLRSTRVRARRPVPDLFVPPGYKFYIVARLSHIKKLDFVFLTKQACAMKQSTAADRATGSGVGAGVARPAVATQEALRVIHSLPRCSRFCRSPNHPSTHTSPIMSDSSAPNSIGPSPDSCRAVRAAHACMHVCWDLGDAVVARLRLLNLLLLLLVAGDLRRLRASVHASRRARTATRGSSNPNNTPTTRHCVTACSCSESFIFERCIL